MRKLNKGHLISICYINESSTREKINESSLSSDIYRMIISNEERQTNQNKLLLIYQYLKFFVRKYHTHHYYILL